MEFRIEIGLRPGYFNARGAELAQSVKHLGIQGVRDISVQKLYFLEGELSSSELERLCQELLSNPIVEEYSWRPLEDSSSARQEEDAAWAVEVTYLPGVADSVADSVLFGAQVMGLSGVRAVKTGQRYLISGELSEAEVREIAERLLHNAVIQRYTLGELMIDFSPVPPKQPTVRKVSLSQASDEELLELSRQGMLALDLAEMQAIRAYFRKLGREPTDVELETLAQTWSEHCVHKSFKALVDYEEWEGESLVKRESIQGLLPSYLMAATHHLDKPWLISAFVDNAGIIEFDEDYEISFKVETHNHPSALEPFGGANTGTGGVLRDIIGVSAKPIAATDILCFGPLELPFSQLPREVLHPRRLYEGVVAGIMDYGNKFGVPTVNGAILFHPDYVGNPLVFCGAVGIAPRGSHPRNPKPGDRVVVVGGRTGRDGIHGVTLASTELTERSGREAGSAVQIGNPIMEKKFHDVILGARDERLYSAITDCGGGGLSSAVGEMAQEIGVRVDLSLVPLKYQGLEPWEIWISEAQERMLLAVPPENLERTIRLFAEEDVEATCIGEFTGDGELQLLYGERLVGRLSMNFLHDGRPQRRLKAIWKAPEHQEPDFDPPETLTEELKAILASPNVCSKEAVIRRYDHEVQGATVLKPLVGMANDGPSDGAIIKPLFHSPKGAIITNGINPLYGAIDPYWMAASAIDEALRNLVAVGGDISQAVVLDNFCWGNPSLPDRMGALVRAARACHDIALGYQVPFISGKDSLNNEYRDTQTGESISIPPTLLISALGIIPDVGQAVTMDLKRPGNAIYLVGMTRRELGGSHYYMLKGFIGGSVPRVDPFQGRELMLKLYEAVRRGLVAACHDLSEGGLGVAAAEMAFAGGFGTELELGRVPSSGVERDDFLLFSESNTRFLVEVAQEDRAAFEGILAGTPLACIGRAVEEKHLKVLGLDEREVVSAELAELKEAWQRTLGEAQYA